MQHLSAQILIPSTPQDIEVLPALSEQDISVDILGMFIFILAIMRGVKALFENNLTMRQKIFISTFMVIGMLFSFQTIFTILTGERPSVIVWDIINYLTALLSLAYISTAWKKLDEPRKNAH